MGNCFIKNDMCDIYKDMCMSTCNNVLLKILINEVWCEMYFIKLKNYICGF